MKCHICGSKLKQRITDLPFKMTDESIIIIKQLPVLQCNNCSQYSLQDTVLEQVDKILDQVDKTVELEVIHYSSMAA